MRLIDNYEAIKKHLEGKIEEKDEIIEQKELEIKRLETQLHKTHDALHAAKKTIAPLEPESKQATHNTQRKSRKKYPGKSKGRSTAAP
jgi:chromosome segregation ATPase